MKPTFLPTSAISLLIVLSICFPRQSRAAAGTNAVPAATIAVEDLGYDYHNGKSNKISHVSRVTPTHVWVVYEGGTSGRNIPRSELKSPLKEQFPYQIEEVEKHIENQALEVQARNAAQKRALQQKEREMQVTVDTLEKTWKDKQRDINAVNRQLESSPNSKILKRKRIQLIEDQKEIAKRRDDLRGQMKQLRARIDAMP